MFRRASDRLGQEPLAAARPSCAVELITIGSVVVVGLIAVFLAVIAVAAPFAFFLGLGLGILAWKYRRFEGAISAQDLIEEIQR